MNDGGEYVIRVRQRLEESWADWFAPLELRADGAETEIVGFLPDQSALHGVIGRLQRLGLSLISINRVDGAPQAGESGSPVPSQTQIQEPGR